MGIASNAVLKGDLIFWVPGSRKAVLLRMYPSEFAWVYGRFEVQAIGTALVTANVVHQEPESFYGLDHLQKFRIHLDAMTIFTLLD